MTHWIVFIVYLSFFTNTPYGVTLATPDQTSCVNAAQHLAAYTDAVSATCVETHLK